MRAVTVTSAYFARHELDTASKSRDWGDESDPSVVNIAWLLQGKEAGRRWADGLKHRLTKTAEEQHLRRERQLGALYLLFVTSAL